MSLSIAFYKLEIIKFGKISFSFFATFVTISEKPDRI